MTYRPQIQSTLDATPRLWHRFHISTQKLAVVLSITAVITGFAYVMVTNSTAAQGFAIKGLQQKIASLQDANQKLGLQADSVQNLATVQADSTQLNLQPTDSFQYLATAPDQVAVR